MAATPLEDLAAYLDAALPPEVAVYGYPPDVVTLPAVVLVLRESLPYAQGGAPGPVALGVDAHLTVQRPEPQYGERALYDLFLEVVSVLAAAPHNTRWESLGEATTATVSDSETLQRTLTLSMIHSN